MTDDATLWTPAGEPRLVPIGGRFYTWSPRPDLTFYVDCDPEDESFEQWHIGYPDGSDSQHATLARARTHLGRHYRDRYQTDTRPDQEHPTCP